MMNFQTGMYVRIPYDQNYPSDPRIFLLGQITAVQDIQGTLDIKFHDPFGYVDYYQESMGTLAASMMLKEYPARNVTICSAAFNTRVMWRRQIYHILGYHREPGLPPDDGFMVYFLQREADNAIVKASEKQLQIPFMCAQISPAEQMLRNEWHNPQWYIGRTIVSQAMHALNNSLSGFQLLAGCKIEIMPHQLLTIMRCTQNDPCRCLLADEVGMGKTVEALGVLRIFIDKHPHCRVLILVPQHLRKQWAWEMLFKFDLSETSSNCHLTLGCIEQVAKYRQDEWDFLIADEVHHALSQMSLYIVLQALSHKSQNVLLLSATPLQARGREYLRLLRLLDPDKYNNIDEDSFADTIQKQNKLEKAVYHISTTMQEMRNDIDDIDGDPRQDEGIVEYSEDLVDYLDELQKMIPDDRFIESAKEKWQTAISDTAVLRKKDPLRLNLLESALARVAEEYQLAANIMRSRRSMLQDELENEPPKRELEVLDYNLDNPQNPYEESTYQSICKWMSSLAEQGQAAEMQNSALPILKACLSSVFALHEQLSSLSTQDAYCLKEICDKTQQWLRYEQNVCENINDALDEDVPPSRICTVLNYLNEVKGKAVLFTEYPATWHAYAECLQNSFFGDEAIALYSADATDDERERCIFRFQNLDVCQFMLVDSSGGEGHNFQMARYAIHLDIPWDIGAVEQRIGRLDRIGRPNNLPITSVVPYAQGTLEEDFFHILQDGLKIFDEPLSGLEIIMSELDNEIGAALLENPIYGLQDILPTIKGKAEKLKKDLAAERIYDIKKFRYGPLDSAVRNAVREYKNHSGQLFAKAMQGWASMAGFNAAKMTADPALRSFDAGGFSYNAAWQAMLIPPSWEHYLQDERSRAIHRMQAIVDDVSNHGARSAKRIITGTFDREKALELDHVHFFAPGDPIFDCITKSALSSCRGRCAAFRVECNVDWQGLVFSYTLKPNYEILYEQGLDDEMCRTYFSLLRNRYCPVFVTMPGSPAYTPAVKEEYDHYMTPDFLHDTNSIYHLGRRSTGKAIPEAASQCLSNAKWLIQNLPGQDWLRKATNTAERTAYSGLISEKSLQRVDDAIQMDLRKAGATLTDSQWRKKIKDMDLVKRALHGARPYLESIAYIWMHKE